ncbi:MAG: SRPBCC family protein [Myxococcota bacterium]
MKPRHATSAPRSLFLPRQSAWLLLALGTIAMPTRGAAQTPLSVVSTGQSPHAESAIRWGHAEAELDWPVEAIAAVLEDYEGYAAFMPKFQRSKVIAARGSRARVYMEVSAAGGALTFWGQLELTRDAADDGTEHAIEARLLDGNIDAFSAEWRLRPSEDGKGSIVEFRIFVDPDLPLPSSLISRENERAARRSVEALAQKMTEVSP